MFESSTLIFFICLLISVIFFSRNGKPYLLFYLKLFLYYMGLSVFSLLNIPCALLNGKRNGSNVRLTAWLMNLLNRLCLGIQYEVRNKHIIEKEGARGCVVTSNHQSSLDILGDTLYGKKRVESLIIIWSGNDILIQLYTKRSPFVSSLIKFICHSTAVCTAKKALLYTGHFGLCLYAMGVVFIDRKNAKQCKSVLSAVEDKLEKSEKVFIFPEGTRSMGKEMLSFRKGAFVLAIQTQVPVIPIVFSSYSSFYDTKKRIFNSGKVIISVLPPIPTHGLTIDDTQDLADRVRCVMMKEYLLLNQEVEKRRK